VPKTRQTSLLSYGIAVLSVIAATLVTWSLLPLMQHSIFLFFIIAVMLSAWRGGHGPGLTASVLSAFLSDYFFFPPFHTIGPFDTTTEALPFFLFIPIGLLVSILLAESHRARERLAETSETLEAIIDAAPLAIIAIDPEGKIKTWNPSAERIFGWRAHEVIGRINPVVPDDKLEEYRGIRQRALLGKGFTERETIRLKKDGSVINVNVSTAGLRGRNGTSSGTTAIIADITEQKRAEAALRESEQRFRATFEQAAVGIVQVTRDGKLLRVNQRFCDLLGYTQAELLSKTVQEITHPEDREPGRDHMNRLWAGEIQAATIERLYLRKDGSSVSGNLTASIVRDGLANPLYFIAVIEDTTERKRAEEAVQESEKRFRAIFEHAAVGIAQVALDGKWMTTNPRFCDIVGYTQAELRERTFLDLTHPDDRQASHAGRAMLLTGEREAITMEKRYLRKDGSPVWTLVSVSVSKDAFGDPEFFLTVIEDIAERKRAEEALVRLATAVEQAAESIVITDPEGIILYVNPAFEFTTGYSRDEVIGQHSRLLNSGKQDSTFYGDLWATIKRGDVWTGHFINRKKDGTVYEEEATISPVRDTSGNITNFVAVKRDVTKEVGLEKQLIQSQKMEAIGTLAGGIAHDFNNLLTAIVGYSQLAMGKLGQEHALRSDIVEIEKAGQRAATLTSQLLAFSRKQVFQFKTLDLNALVTDLQKMLKRMIGEDIEIVALLNLELWSIRADPGQLQQVIMNLVVNARDAMPNGGKLTIETDNVDLDSEYDLAQGPYVMISISDTGCGMDMETRSHIFEPFFTTKELGRGTGLGLSTVYGIVKQSGGSIWVDSEPDHGTTFKVFLPRVSDPVEEPEGANTPATVPGGTETLLLVEDEASVRELTARVLKERGYHVLDAANGPDALRLMANRPPNDIQLLITDVVMPKMGGPDLAARLARSQDDLKVLFISGYTDKAIARDGVLVEGTPFLQKPFTPDALAGKVREVLDAQGPLICPDRAAENKYLN